MIDVYKFLKKFTKVELVYTNTSNKKYTFCTEINDVLDDKILLAYPNENFNMVSDNMKLTAVFCTEDGVLSGNVNIIKADAIKKNVLISFPYNNQYCQRRENTRVPMHVNIELSLENSNEKLYLKTKNISGKGVACLTKEPLPAFNDAKITIHMPSKSITTLCKKVYSKEINMDNEIIFINGIMLTTISDDDVNVIVKDTFKFQMDSKHNEKLFETL